MLLNTNVCKKNKDVYDFVNEMDCSKRNIAYLIIDGCIKNVSGSFEWDYMTGN